MKRFSDNLLESTGLYSLRYLPAFVAGLLILATLGCRWEASPGIYWTEAGADADTVSVRLDRCMQVDFDSEAIGAGVRQLDSMAAVNRRDGRTLRRTQPQVNHPYPLGEQRTD